MPGGLYLVMLPPYGDGGRLRCSPLCISDRQTWSSCDVTVNSVTKVSSAEGGPELVPTVARRYYAIYPDMSWITIWNLVSSGGVR